MAPKKHNIDMQTLVRELGEDSAKIIRYGLSNLEPKRDHIDFYKESGILDRGSLTVDLMRRWLQKRGISTKNQIPFMVDGRKVVDLSKHPKVKKKTQRRAEIKEELDRRARRLEFKYSRDPRTQHWFDREAI